MTSPPKISVERLQAWSGALVLLLLVGALNLAARLATRARFSDPSR